MQFEHAQECMDAFLCPRITGCNSDMSRNTWMCFYVLITGCNSDMPRNAWMHSYVPITGCNSDMPRNTWMCFYVPLSLYTSTCAAHDSFYFILGCHRCITRCCHCKSSMCSTVVNSCFRILCSHKSIYKT